MKARTKAKILKFVAVAIDIIAPVIAAATQFPIWIHKGKGATLSGLFIVVAIICIIPAFRALVKHINTPGMPIVWTVLFAVLFALSRIIEQMLIVCIVGIISNLIGAGIYLYGDRVGSSDNYNNEGKIQKDTEVVNDGEA